MNTLVCCLEEVSAQAMLEGVIPRLIPDGWSVRYIPFRGKQDLDKNLKKRLQGWLAPNSYFLVLRDKDAGDCVSIKDNLVTLCMEAGKPGTLVRIACRELESFYFGDLSAVEEGLKLTGLVALRNKARYRNPDALGNPSEELMKLTKGVYQKVAGSRAIGPLLNLENNKSHSFNMLIGGIKRLVSLEAG
jgi:hypothetical protein